MVARLGRTGYEGYGARWVGAASDFCFEAPARGRSTVGQGARECECEPQCASRLPFAILALRGCTRDADVLGWLGGAGDWTACDTQYSTYRQ